MFIPPTIRHIIAARKNIPMPAELSICIAIYSHFEDYATSRRLERRDLNLLLSQEVLS